MGEGDPSSLIESHKPESLSSSLSIQVLLDILYGGSTVVDVRSSPEAGRAVLRIGGSERQGDCEAGEQESVARSGTVCGVKWVN